ncbi:serine hydrolase [Pedobacter sp. BS3]|uniref:serine hydrolase n=1 Tax=Pedobacter sp. BS3 TaxID=2567937 RepID=UPI0011EE1FA0|nr:serine hydrolase [Pedobacter sp. BS3]TZF83032.1 serine hydrolase [Pedobacter sp. BS3]
MNNCNTTLKRLFLYLILIIPLMGSAQTRTDKKLQTALEALVKNFHGDVGIYVKNLKTGSIAAIHANTIFPTASMIKVPIMIGIADKIERGELHYNDKLLYRDSLSYNKDDIIGCLADSTFIDLSKVQLLSITTSDNTASLWLQQLAGSDNINNWLAAHGYEHTRVNSHATGREQYREKYGWGQSTPREMAGLFEQIRNGHVVSPAASERMYRNLIRIYWDGIALSQIPPYIQAASKQGAINASRSETVLVNAPHGDYVFSVITKNLQDQSWHAANEGWQLIRDVSALLWHYFEPDSNWKPSAGMEKFSVYDVP